jgi:two-component system cell cycle response regulator DivK
MNPAPTAATFSFHEAPTLPARPGSRRGPVDGRMILIVEDDADTRYIFTECLFHLGYRTASASTGELGVRAALQHRPDAVLMDLSMPGIGGIEATRRIKADPRTRNCLVIVVTAQGPSMFDRSREAGCDAYFCKPFNAFALDRVLRLLGTPGSNGPSRTRKHVVKRCECSREFTFDAWLALPLCGRMHVPASDTVLELRNCPCGSSIVLPV